MRSSLHEWESDPLFSAAEIVQDSADRMESIFRLLLHEQNLVQGDNLDPRLHTSIEFHKRDLATILETAKWQLEDFERAVYSSAMTDKYQRREDVIFRHKQFISAIREQINHVEEKTDDVPVGRMKSSVNLNDQDRDGLALFLSGGKPTEQNSQDREEVSGRLMRFLDPNTASTSKDAGHHEISECVNETVHDNLYSNSSKESNLRNVGSQFSIKLGEDSNWDMEANDARPESFFQEDRINAFRFLSNIWNGVYTSRSSGMYTKKMKDGEEQHSRSYFNASQGNTSIIGDRKLWRSGFLTHMMPYLIWLRSSLIRYRRLSSNVHNQRSIQMILAAVFTLILIGLLVSRFF